MSTFLVLIPTVPVLAQNTLPTAASAVPAPGDAAPGDAALAAIRAGAGSDDAASQPADPAGATPWTLDQLIDRALRDNPRVREQRAGEDVARAGLAAARWEYFPTPAVQVEGTAHEHLVTATLTQPLYTFGRIGSALAAARAQARSAGFRTGETRHDTALRVLELYGQFASVNRQIAVLSADIQRHRDLEAMIHRRVEAGVSAPVDLNLVQTRLNQSRISRMSLLGRQRALAVAIGELVGVTLPVAAIAVAAPGSGAEHGPGADPAGAGFFVDQLGNGELVQRCLDRNPSLQRAEADIVVAQAEVRRARATVFPTIVARLENRSYTHGYPSSGLPDTRLTVGVTLSTGAGLATRENMRVADGRSRAAELARDALRQDVTSAVVSALETFTAARRSVDGLRQIKLVQEQTADSYNRMFLAGKRSWLDLLNMVREQSGIERDLADAEVQLMVADYRLRIEAGEIA